MEINEIRHLLTYDCVLRCLHCYLSAGDHPEVKSVDFTQEQADRFYGYFKPEVVSATGGEPLLKPELVKNLARATAKYDGGLELVTNGILLTEDLVNELNQLNPNLFYQISLDGLEDYHDYTRQRKGAFKAAIKAIDLASKSGRLTKARMTVTPGNYEEIPDVIKLLDGLEGSKNIKLVMRAVLTTGRAKENELRFSEDLSSKLQEFKTMAKNIDLSITDRCGYCLDSITIDPSGNIYPCCYFVFSPDFLMGNWLDNPADLKAQPEFANYSGKCFAVEKFSNLSSSDNRCETCLTKGFIKSK